MPDFTSSCSNSGPVRLGRAARLFVPALVAGALLAPGCGNSTPTIPGNISRAVITVAVEPNPVTGTLNTATFVVTANYTLTLKETAGLGGEVQFISSAVYDPASGAQVALNYYDSTDLVVYQGTKRIEANGTLTLQQSATYAVASHTTAADLVVTMQLKDDRSNLDFASLLVKIQ
jgi:hypothetical protein